MAYARLGVPDEIIDYIIDIDDDSMTIIRSPQTLHTMEKDVVKGFVLYSSAEEKNTKKPQYSKV